MKRLFIVILLILLTPLYAGAIELLRQKSTPTFITFPIVDADGDTVSTAAALDSEIETWDDATTPDGFVACTFEATEIGSEGIYHLYLTQDEMNADYIYVIVQTSTSGAKTQHILIRTVELDPAAPDVNVAQVAGNAVTDNDDGMLEVNVEKFNDTEVTENLASVNVSGGVIEANVEQIADDAVTDNADGILVVNINKASGSVKSTLDAMKLKVDRIGP